MFTPGGTATALAVRKEHAHVPPTRRSVADLSLYTKWTILVEIGRFVEYETSEECRGRKGRVDEDGWWNILWFTHRGNSYEIERNCAN